MTEKSDYGMGYALLPNVFIVTSNLMVGNGTIPVCSIHNVPNVCRLAIAVSTKWMVILGGEIENQSPPPNLEELADKHIVFSKPYNRSRSASKTSTPNFLFSCWITDSYRQFTQRYSNSSPSLEFFS